MSKEILVFLDTAGNFKEREILLKFYDGIPDTYSKNVIIGHKYKPCDIAVMMGSWKPRDKDHHLLRTEIAENSRLFIVIETPLLGRRMFEENTHQRLGINGFLNNAGTFFYKRKFPEDRLQQLGIKWNNWRNNLDGHILLMLQLPGDASLRNIDIYSWAFETIQSIRKYTDKKIIVRTHPGVRLKDLDPFHKLVSDVTLAGIKDIEYSIGRDRSLDTDLENAYCSVSYTSGSSIDSILKGIPAIACDPGNFAFDISSTYISDINNLELASEETVNNWLKQLSYSQWTHDEMASGKAFKNIEPALTELDMTLPRRKK